MSHVQPEQTTPRILIVGGGAGGLELATRLGRTLGKRGRADIVLIDRNMTHIWKPLLHEVAAGSLNPSEDELNYVAQAKWNHFEFQLGQMSALAREQRLVTLDVITDEDGDLVIPQRQLHYDYLVIAVGSHTDVFATPGADEHCLFLDTRAEAERLHRMLLNQYLKAQCRADEPTKEVINVAIVGGGATGVELAAELQHAARQLLAYGLDQVRPQDLNINLIEASDRLLSALPERLSVPVTDTLDKLGVKLHLESKVKEVTATSLILDNGKEIPASLKVWAAGISAPSFLSELGLETNKTHQLLVHKTLQTTQDEHIFAFGDCAACPMGEKDRFVPARAQAAHQQVEVLAKNLGNVLSGKRLKEFRFRDHGSLISLSKFTAVGTLASKTTGSVMLEGRLARFAYISLYRMHQVELFGVGRTLLRILSGLLARGAEPRLKLH